MKRLSYFVVLVLLLVLAGCSEANPVSQIVTTPVPPRLTIIEAPEFVCSAITQIRLEVNANYSGSSDQAGEWQLVTVNSDTIIHRGTWELDTSDIFITFPEGKALPAGSYRVNLIWDDTILADHEFTVSSTQPAITDVSISLIPQHTVISELKSDTMHFYVNFNWAGGCQGAPYWVKVYHNDALICRHSAILTEGNGNGSHACYTQDGLPFDAGVYSAVFTLMDAAEQELVFTVAKPEVSPTPTPTPEPQIVTCGEAFSAAGILQEGEVYRDLYVHEWYTQVVYVGVYCQNLSSGMEWTTTWYRDGEYLRSTTQTWEGYEQGLLWDAFTGTLPHDPFVFPGTYTSTLEIDSLAPVTVEFQVAAYLPTDSEITTEP